MVRSEIYVKLLGLIIKNGNKKLAVKILADMFKFIKINFKLNPLKVIMQALLNVRPLVSLKKKYRAGQAMQVPFFITGNVSVKLALRWIIKAAKERPEPIPFSEKLAYEFHDAFLRKGGAINYKRQLYIIALKNKTLIKNL